MRRFCCHKYVIPWILVSATLLSPGLQGVVAADDSPVPRGKYNLILVFVDALRADHLGSYGYYRDTSPNMDNLAEDGTLFEEVYTPHTVTLSSFMSLITSLYPDSHGVRHILKDRLAPEVMTLAQRLKTADFNTFWLGPADDPHLDMAVGYGRGFNYTGSLPGNMSQAGKLILETLDKAKKGRFFLNFHTYKVHDPYLPSGEFKNAFTDRSVPGVMETLEEIEEATVRSIKYAIRESKGLAWEQLGPELIDGISKNVALEEENKYIVDTIYEYLESINKSYKWHSLILQVYSSNESCDELVVVDQLRAFYDASILEFDSRIVGPMVDYLKANNLYDSTVIAIVADHGEEFCEHGGLRHGTTLYREGTHVPFILRVPGMPAGRRVGDRLLQTVDIAPTLLDLLEVDPLPLAQGISQASLVRGGQAGSFPRRYAYGTIPYLSYIRDDRWKFIIPRECINYTKVPSWMCRSLPWLFEEDKELFDLSSDPQEQINVYEANRETAARLEKEFSRWTDSLPNYSAGQTVFPSEIDKDTRDRIRRTGYW